MKRAINDESFKISTRINNRQLKLMRQLGIFNDYKIDELLLFQKYVEEAIENGCDLITLDTLSSLADNPWEITRNYVREISQLCRRKGVSLLILQHTTKKGDYSGTSGLAQVVDTLLYIEDLGKNLRSLKVEKARFEKNREGCIFELISEGDNSIELKVCENPSVSCNNFSSKENEIINIIGDNESIDFQYLIEELGSTNSNSVKNQLLSLEKKGAIKKADGKTWDIISNCNMSY